MIPRNFDDTYNVTFLKTGKERKFSPSNFSDLLSLRRSRSEVVGIRTPVGQIKNLLCCRYTTTPYEDVAPFVCVFLFHGFLLFESLEIVGYYLNQRRQATCFSSSGGFRLLLKKNSEETGTLLYKADNRLEWS